MAQLSRAALDRAVGKVRGAAQAAATSCDELMRRIFEAHPGISVAEARERAIRVMQVCLERYGAVSAEVAAALYDQIMAAEGLDVPPADAEWAVDREQLEATARYQAGKLASGDLSEESKAEFRSQCCSYVRDSTRRAYDSTVARNVERDSARGVRYARMTGGSETCTFCVMVASRGFVYTSAAAAGAGHRYHRGCDCYVVPGVKGSTSVRGVDLDEMRDKWQAFEEIDSRGDLTRAQKDAAKAAWGPGGDVGAGYYVPFVATTDRTDIASCAAAVNRNYGAKGAGDMWAANCQRCVVAYEMRRRGYDVVAKPRPVDGNGDRYPDDSVADRRSGRSYADAFVDGQGRARSAKWFDETPGDDLVAAVEREMSGYGVGSRAFLTVNDPANPSNGHVFVIECTDEGVRYVDPQCGKVIGDAYLRDCYSKAGSVFSPSLLRVDDLQPTDIVHDCCEEGS